MCPCKKIIAYIPCALVAIGALNWGLVGAFNLDIVAYLLGHMTTPTRIIYILIGASALYKIIAMVRCKSCDTCSTK